jgi:predicted amidophosphoribosyltransferase
LLRRRGRVRDSAGLAAAQRRANLAGPFAPAGTAPSRGLLVLVVDVVTSGATLTEAASVLARARSVHAAPVLAAVVAATPRRDPASAREKPTVR